MSSRYSSRWLTRDHSRDDASTDSDKSGDLLGSRLNKRSSLTNRSPSPNTFARDTLPPPKKNFEMAGPGTKLAQEIHDEFLICKICLEAYKTPRSLTCLHTFCEQCIENHAMSESSYKKYSDYREFCCPLCRKRTQLPIGGVKKLPDNFLVASLSEIVARQKPTKFPFCDICKMVSHRHKEAASKCLDCAKLLCVGCVAMHRETKVTANHSIFDVEIEKDIECKEHEDEVVRFYCEPCETCICVLCTFNEHKDHEISQFGEAVQKYKDNIEHMLDGCKTKINKFDSQLEDLNKCEGVIKDAEKKIHDAAIQFIADIRNREKQLIEELQNIYGQDCMEQIENKKDLSGQVDNLRSTCNLTEVILQGKDIELLLLKKEVQEKLNALSSVEIKNLPATVNKRINYSAGSIDFGFIQDLDRPLASRMRIKKQMSSAQEAEWPTFTEKETQTDIDPKSGAKKNSNEAASDSDEDSDSDASGDSDEEDSDTEEEEEKPELVDSGVQTEQHDSSSSDEDDSSSDSDDDSAPEMKDEAMMTDEIETVEIGVNTRSRCLGQNQRGGSRTSPGKESGEDNSLAARRRRRRERAQSTIIPGSSADNADDTDDNNTYADKRKSRMSRLMAASTPSLDADDTFYDTVARPTKNYV